MPLTELHSNRKSFIVAIAGGTGSGKSALADAIVCLSQGEAAIIRQDWYYWDLSELPNDERGQRNFDHPDSYDRQRLKADLQTLQQGFPAQVPQYNFRTHTRLGFCVFAPVRIVIVEGILVLADAELRDVYDYRIYVDTPDDIRLLRRIERDIRERGRTLESIRDQYLATVRPMHKTYIAPTRSHADLVVRGDTDLFETSWFVWNALQQRFQS